MASLKQTAGELDGLFEEPLEANPDIWREAEAGSSVMDVLV